MKLMGLATFIGVLQSIGNTLLDILIFVLVLGLIVGIHEFGHFLFARKAKVLCREFAIGMGPRLWKKKKGETTYSLRAFPIGGFCAIAGEEVEADPFASLDKIKLDIEGNVIKGIYTEVENEKYDYPVYNLISYDIYDEKQTGNLFMEVEQDSVVQMLKVDPQAIVYTAKDEFQIAPFNRTLGAKGKGARALVMFGGPLMNFLLAILVFFIVGLFTGFSNLDSRIVGEVTYGTSISEYYQKSYTKEEIPSLNNTTNLFAIECETLGKVEIDSWNDVESFLDNYDKKELEESIYVTFTRDTYLASDDEITSLYSESMGKKEILTWNDVKTFMSEYNSKSLAEAITIEYIRDEVEYSIVSSPFFSINNFGIGSGWYYDLEKAPVIKAYNDELTSSSRGLGDNSQLQLGDEIIKIEEIVNPTWEDIRKVSDAYIGDSDNEDENWISMVVRRLNSETNEYEEIDVKVKPYSKELMENQTPLDGGEILITDATIGISATTKFSFIKSIGYAFTQTGKSFAAIFDTLKLLFNSTVSIKNLSGPIGIFSITSQARSAGFTYVLRLVGMLTVNIGLLNLFPIPALDGGRLVFIGYEVITGKKPNPKVETILITITMLLLFGLMIFVAFEDILGLIK